MYVCFKAGNFTRFLSNSVRKEKKPFIFPLFPKPFLDLSRGGRYLGGGRKEGEKKKDGKKIGPKANAYSTLSSIR